MKLLSIRVCLLIITILTYAFVYKQPRWNSKFVTLNTDGSLIYPPDDKGDIIPDFSRVGYHHGNKEIPQLKIVKTIYPVKDDAGKMLQKAIDEVSALKPDKNGFRGAILVKKGIYKIADSLLIHTNGVVIKGEGNTKEGTCFIATGKKIRSLINIQGQGKITEIKNTRTKITDNYTPVGSYTFNVESANKYKIGDRIILFRPGTKEWIHDLKMDSIVERKGTKQWTAEEYNLSYERNITAINGNKITIDNPFVMVFEKQYGGGEIFKYDYNGRIKEAGIENIYFESEYNSDIDEEHARNAIKFDHIENGWASNVTSNFFSSSCVTLYPGAKNITVKDAKCFDAKSIITGGRRYSFNNEGQQNLFMNLETTEGRHDFVTGAKTCGPNVFYNCKARQTHSDIGPHHRWASGTLYDNIDTDGQINIQDRGFLGSGHGWAGVTQVLWNCKAKTVVVQSPWISGKNYAIGIHAKKGKSQVNNRPEAEWEGFNQPGLIPGSLYKVQLKARYNKN